MRSAALVFGSLSFLASCSQSGGHTDGASGNRPIPIAAADLKWVDLDPAGASGVKLATLSGDPASGTFGAFFRLPAGFTAPLHTHTHRMKVVIVSGTYIQEPERAPAFRLGPGSYLMQPGGTYRHATSCDTTADCVILSRARVRLTSLRPRVRRTPGRSRPDFHQHLPRQCLRPATAHS